jgi:broad specificity phosphatase PhoE
MQISLIKHGRSSLQSSMNVKQFQEWLERCNQEGDVQKEQVPADTVEAIHAAKLVVASASAQAIQSAALLTDSLSFVQNPIFCEVNLPVLSVPKWMKMKPDSWVFIHRAMWLAGYTKNTETYEQVRFRAKQAVDLLVGYALCYQKVALVGHGFFNSMIAKELKQRGWVGPVFMNQEHWSSNTYKYPKAFEGMKQGIEFTVS